MPWMCCRQGSMNKQTSVSATERESGEVEGETGG